MKLNLYAAGGTGINIAKRVGDLDINIIYVDTSVSNLKSVNSPNVFLVEGMDGAGKHLATTYENFKDISPDVLMKYPPSPFLNVVVGSLSGGSGAVIGPMLTSRLVDSGFNTAAIGVLAKHSFVEINNALKSLRSYRGVSGHIGKAVSLFFVDGQTRSEEDQTVLHLISLLSLLVDKRYTEEFDTSDLKSFLSFDRVTENEPTVAIVEVMANEQFTPEKGTSVVGSILLTSDKSSTIQPAYPEYMATCIVTDPEYKNTDIRINSLLGKLSLIIDDLESKQKTHTDGKQLNKVRDVSAAPTRSDGMCL